MRHGIIRRRGCVLGLLLATVLLACELETDLCGNPIEGSSVFTTCLGSEVDKVAALSPSFRKHLPQLEKDGWKIEYWNALGSVVEKENKRIAISSSVKGDVVSSLQTLAHEVGHALYSEHAPDYRTRAAYISSMLAHEGAATLYNIQVQREILANNGLDIHIVASAENHGRYHEIYDRLLGGALSEEGARREIGEVFRHGEYVSISGGAQTYEQYFGEWYDKHGEQLKRNGTKKLVQPLR